MLRFCLASPSVDSRGGCRRVIFASLFAGYGGALSLTAAVIAQGDVHKDVASDGLKADHQGFGVFASARTVVGGVEHWGMDAEVEALVVQRSDGIADGLVGHFANGLTDQFVRLRNFGAGEVGGDAPGSTGIEVEDDPALDVPRDPHQSRYALAAI